MPRNQSAISRIPIPPLRRQRAGNARRPFNRLRIPGLVTIPRSMTGQPSALRVTLAYYDGFTPLASVSGYLALAANDIFAPRASVSGCTSDANQQPNSRDRWATFFNTYRVLSSSVSVDFVQQFTTNTVSTHLSIVPEDAFNGTTNAPQSATARYAWYHLMPAGASQVVTTTRHMDSATINGVPESQIIDSPSFDTAVGSSPTDQWYWMIRFSSTDFTTLSGVYGRVIMYQDVLFSDPVQRDQND